MKVLVVGKGTKEQPTSWRDHCFTFMETPKPNATVPDMALFDLGLFHLSEDKESFEPVLDKWKAAGAITKVITISGGSLKQEQASRLRELGDVPFIGGIDDAEAILRLRWQVIAADCQWNVLKIARTLKEPDSLLSALMIIAQGVLCFMVRTSSDQTKIEYLDVTNCAWKNAGNGEAETLRKASKLLGISVGVNPLGMQATSFTKADFWERFNPPLEVGATLGDWLRDEFGSLPCEQTQILLQTIRVGAAPTVPMVAAAIPELRQVLGVD